MYPYTSKTHETYFVMAHRSINGLVDTWEPSKAVATNNYGFTVFLLIG